MHTRLVAFALVLSSLAPAVARAAVLDPRFAETEFAASPTLTNATGLAWAPDGSDRLFVTVKEGEVRVIKNGIVLEQPFATLAPIYTTSECGLIGIAFDPDFLANRYVYLFVTVSASEQQIVRYTVAGDVGIDKTTIVAGLPTKGANHDGGGIGFGPDGKLYWSIGDNGNGTGTNADLASLAAKVGRANRDGTVPSDNPFADGPDGNNDYIWARGFRNPFTMTFQPATGLLWLDVVGTSQEQIFVVRKGDHGGWTAYENTQPAGFITPVIRYATNLVETHNLMSAAMNGVVRVNGISTFSTLLPHGLRAGEKLAITGVANQTFDRNVFVRSVPSPNTFTVAQPGEVDANSGGGSVSTLSQGGCVTGGTFYDATQFPAEFRGNFFYGDFNSGRIMRATIDPDSNGVTSIDYFGQGIAQQVDITVGPDGALYYVGHGAKVFRAAYRSTAQGLVVSPLTHWTAEGQSVTAAVHLAVAPPGDVIVTLSRDAGDTDITVSPASLTFTASNWEVPQVATITAAPDEDRADDMAVISVSSDALTTEWILVHARDEIVAPPADAGAPDAGTPDGASPDVAPGLEPDAIAADTAPDQTDDAAQADGAIAIADAGAADAMSPDAPARDADVTEAARPDGGAPDASPVVADAQVADAAAPDDATRTDTAGTGTDAVMADARTGDAAAIDARTTDALAATPDALATTPAATDSSGCSCRVGGGTGGTPGAAFGLVAFGLMMLKRRRRKGHDR
jgi:MYXO-CTERM domain-containing protein